MSRIACLAATAIALVACNTQGSGPGDDDDDDEVPKVDGSMPNDPVQPKAGGWHYAETTPISSTCPANTPTGANGNFVIDQVTAASFHVVPNDGTAPFTCTLSGGQFDCPDRAAATEDYRPQVDAVLTAHATADGTLTSTTRATGRQRATVSCAGTQCDALGPNTFPCSAEVSFVIEAL